MVQEESAALNFLARRGSEADRDSADEEGFVTDDDHAMANAERELAEDAEWKRIQQNTFTRWANEHLKQADKSISDLETDLSDGLKLISLIEVLLQLRIFFQHLTLRKNFCVFVTKLKKKPVRLYLQ